MRYLLYIFVFTFSSQGKGQAPESVSYHPDRKLSWIDFAGSPDYTDTGNAAQISTTIQLRSSKVNFWTGKARFDGSAIMYRDKSWVKPGFRNEYVLSHEQIHFDIAYIAVKRLEADINSLNINILNKEIIDAMYKNWHAIFLLNEQTYDLMTDGGNDRKMQHYYHKKISNELKQLESLIF